MLEPHPDLFQRSPRFPEGFRYQPDLIDAATERRLVAEIEQLDFKPFDFHGFLGKRRIASFGWRYDFSGGGLQKTEEIPPFLLAIRAQAAQRFALEAAKLQQVLVTEYVEGAPIGWHKDRPVFGDVIGISLLSACTLRFRRKSGSKWERSALTLAPRSGYLLRGPSRTEWEHSIPEVEQLRYSLTFRTLKA